MAKQWPTNRLGRVEQQNQILVFLVQLVVVEEIITHERVVSGCTTAVGVLGRVPLVRPVQDLRDLDEREALNRKPPRQAHITDTRCPAPGPHLVGWFSQFPEGYTPETLRRPAATHRALLQTPGPR